MDAVVMELNVAAFWRLLNLVLIIGALTTVLVRLHANWRRLNHSEMLVMLAVFMLLLTVGYSATENLIQGNPFGGRDPLTTAASFWVIWAAGLSWREDKNGMA